MIEVLELGKNYGTLQAVRGISLTVKRGEIFGIVGPDGAGKTTILRIMAGVLEPSAGQVLFSEMEKGRPMNEQKGYMPQNFSLYEEFSVWENIAFFGSMFGLGKKELHTRGEEMLSMVGLSDFAKRPAGKLSGGMKQKLALACALLHQPEILILDEPSTGVDPVSRREFWEILYTLNSRGITVVVSTPYMDEAELCSRLAFIHHGKILITGTPEEICRQYPWKVVEVRTPGTEVRRELEKLPFHDMNSFGDSLHVAGKDVQDMIREVESVLSRFGMENQYMNEIPPSLEDVFVEYSRKR